MEVCGSEVLTSPMTNQGEHSDLEKVSSIDPCSMTASMELKVGITREGNQHSQQLPSPQEHLNNVPEPGDIPSRSPSMATEADARVGQAGEAEHNGHLGNDEEDDINGSHGDEEEEERDGQDQSYSGYEPRSQQHQPDEGDEEIQCDDETQEGDQCDDDMQEGDQCDDDTQEGDEQEDSQGEINLESEMDDSVLSTGSPDKQSDERGENSDSNLRHDHLHNNYDSEYQNSEYHNEDSVQLDENSLRQEHKYEPDDEDSVLVDDEGEEGDGDGDLANESYDDSEYPITDSNFPDGTEIPRRGRGRPRGSKNRSDGSGRGRGRGFKFRRLSEDRTCTAYDLRNIPDPFNCQRRGRPRSRFIVDLGEQNHEAWTKAKEELNISDAELTTLLLS
ncbi:unnamed protein product, partial [Meganyctiphanes norvegica]